MFTSLEKSVNSKMLSVCNIAYYQDQRYLQNIGKLEIMGIVKNSMIAAHMTIFKVIETMIKSGFFIKEVDQPMLTIYKEKENEHGR